MSMSVLDNNYEVRLIESRGPKIAVLEYRDQYPFSAVYNTVRLTILFSQRENWCVSLGG